MPLSARYFGPAKCFGCPGFTAKCFGCDLLVMMFQHGLPKTEKRDTLFISIHWESVGFIKSALLTVNSPKTCKPPFQIKRRTVVWNGQLKKTNCSNQTTIGKQSISTFWSKRQAMNWGREVPAPLCVSGRRWKTQVRWVLLGIVRSTSRQTSHH